MSSIFVNGGGNCRLIDAIVAFCDITADEISHQFIFVAVKWLSYLRSVPEAIETVIQDIVILADWW